MESRGPHPGESVVIKGQVIGGEDLTIAGSLEGTIDLRGHVLTVTNTARISAKISAKTVVIAGSVAGNIDATEKVELRESGSVRGDITASRVAVADGAQIHGRVDMQRPAATTSPRDARPLSVAV